MNTQHTAVISRTNPYAPPRASVRDVVRPSAAAEPADRSTRLAAAILDTIVIGVMVMTPMFLTGAMAPAAGSDGAETMAAVGLGLTLIGFVAWLWLMLRYLATNGQSIAKKMLGIKIVRSDGSPASLGRILGLRYILNGMIGIVPGYGLLDVLFIFGDARQCLHDKLADTIVVKA